MRFTVPLWKSMAVLSLILWGCGQDAQPTAPKSQAQIKILSPDSTTPVDSTRTPIPIILQLEGDILTVEIYVDDQLLGVFDAQGKTVLMTTWPLTSVDLCKSHLIKARAHVAGGSLIVEVMSNIRLHWPNCSPPPDTTSTPPPGPYRYEERFSDPSVLRKWTTTSYGEYSVHDGVLTIIGGGGAGGVTVGTPEDLKTLRNAKVDVDTKWQDGTTLYAYGVWCRFSSEGHYRFCINGEGQFSILRYRAATQTLWPLQDWMRHRAIPPKGDNHLQVLLQDSKFTFVVNSDTVATVYDDTITGGGVALYVESIQQVDFDNLIVEELP